MRVFTPILITVLLIGTFFTITDPDGVSSIIPQPHSWDTLSTSHDPIWIDNNTDFKDTAENESWQGNGSASNPYIISDYIINATGHNCGIYIGNSSVHFIIRNCRIFGARYTQNSFSDKAGIHMFKSSNGTIEECDLEDNRYGITLNYSKNVILLNNTQYMDHWAGIRVYYSENVEISGCTINDTWTDEIIIFRSSNCHVHNNTAGESRSEKNGGDRGVLAMNSEDCLIENNTMSIREGVGISVEGGSNIHILNNICSIDTEEWQGWVGINVAFKARNCLVKENKVWNYKSGIGVGETSSNINIIKNRVWDMKYRGIYIGDSSSCSVIGNDIDDVEHDGILIKSATDTVAKDNYVSNCGDNGIYLGTDPRGIITKGTRIVGNYIENSLDYGIKIFNATDTTITRNCLIYNRMSSDTYNPNAVQAYDNGKKSVWFSEENGNYWYDWTTPDVDMDGVVDSPYSIDGTAGASDDYPLVWNFEPVIKTPPNEPINLTAKVGRTFSYLKWEDPLDNGNTPLLGFRIYRNDTEGDPELIAINEITSHKYNDSDAAGDIEYTYWVSAFNLIGEGNLSDPVNATPVPPFGEMSILIDSPTDGAFWTEKDLTVEWTFQLGERALHSVQIKQDDTAWEDSDSDDSHTFNNLDEGRHTISVKLVAHNLEETDTSLSIHADFNRPVITVTSPVDGAVLTDDHTTLVYSTMDSTTSVISVNYSLDSNDPVDLTGINAMDLNNLTDGRHIIEIRAEDEAGHIGNSTISFTVDTTPPTVLDYGPKGMISEVPEKIFIEFSEEIDNSSMFFEIYPTMDWMVSWDSGNVLTFTPMEDFLLEETYEVSMSGQDLTGHPFGDLSFEFRIELPEGSGTIRGGIFDPLGIPLEGASVQAGNMTTETDANGDFSLSLPPGDHTLNITMEGYINRVIDTASISDEITDLGAIILEPDNDTVPGDDDDDEIIDDDETSDDDDDEIVDDDDDAEDKGSPDLSVLMAVAVVALIIIVAMVIIFVVGGKKSGDTGKEE